MLVQKILFLCFFLLSMVFPLQAIEQFQKGYVEIGDTSYTEATFASLYTHFDELIKFLEINPDWLHKLYAAKERFIRTKDRDYYSTDFFGFYDESKRLGRSQIAFYYSTHFHAFIDSNFPELNEVLPIAQFLKTCLEVQKPCGNLFENAAITCAIDAIYADSPVLLKVIKYFPSHTETKPHYDGSAFSLFLHSTDNQALFLSPYKMQYSADDFFCPPRDYQNSILLIPGAHLTEFSIYPTPHIVAHSGKIRYATIAFAMRSHYKPPLIKWTPLAKIFDE